MPDLATLPDGASVFVDTNIFYLHFRSKSVSCTTFINRIARGKINAYVNTQVLSDLLHKLMLAEAFSKGIISKLSAARLKEKLLSDRAVFAKLSNHQKLFESTLDIGLKVLPITRALLIDSKQERSAHGVMTGDSLHLGNMNRYRKPITDIVTHDGDFMHIPGITVWSPMDVV